VDVAAHDAVHALLSRQSHYPFLEGANETHGFLHTFFHVRTERPEFMAQHPPHTIYRPVELQQKLIANIPDESEPLDILNHRIEFVAVDH